jgi:hypothetical protein
MHNDTCFPERCPLYDNAVILLLISRISIGNDRRNIK